MVKESRNYENFIMFNLQTDKKNTCRMKNLKWLALPMKTIKDDRLQVAMMVVVAVQMQLHLPPQHLQRGGGKQPKEKYLLRLMETCPSRSIRDDDILDRSLEQNKPLAAIIQHLLYFLYLDFSLYKLVVTN